jgi:hypothetical protein
VARGRAALSDQGKSAGPAHVEGEFRARIGELWIEAYLIDLPERVEINLFEIPDAEMHAAIVSGEPQIA